MTVVVKPLTQLQRPERNVRIHSDTQIREYMRSVEMFGQIRPIVIDENDTILAGNGLYDALTQLGRTEADCYIVSGLTDAEKKKLMLADNRIFNLGVDDLKTFDEIVLELGDDFDIPGYDAELLQTLNFDLSDADDMMSGYGIISDEAKKEMQRASEQYEREEAAFAEKAEEIKPVAATQSVPSPAPQSAEPSHPVPAEPAMPPSARKFIVCPKCGEKIWL